MKSSLTALAALLALAAAPAASADTYTLNSVLGAELARVAKKTDVPVRLPASMNLDTDATLYAFATATRRSYSFSLGGSPDCGGANACFIASFSAERGGTPAFKRTVRLTRGITGYYKPLSCGGSCSPPLLEWKQGGVLYGIQAKVGVAGARPQRAEMVRAANSAIRARPR